MSSSFHSVASLMMPGDKTKCTLPGEGAQHSPIFVGPSFGIGCVAFLLYCLHSWNSGNLLCLLANSVVLRPGFSGDECIHVLFCFSPQNVSFNCSVQKCLQCTEMPAV
ncbi:hypothetical protein CDAR_262361 [Caerostris darwini]|uniref:Uncharacterized protein n=1 Tax=Caerostris darwini TaxID=1538125 RepID=A0AAV4QE57_9ARAC|nr:hypothetical protein CDAR_262361 [Caerostris darwini]